MSWNLEGQRVSGMYLGQFPVTGIVRESRVRYGGRVSHTVELENPVEVFGAVRESVILYDGSIEDLRTL
jgi:hypothetical protein